MTYANLLWEKKTTARPRDGKEIAFTVLHILKQFNLFFLLFNLFQFSHHIKLRCVVRGGWYRATEIN